MNFQKAKTLGTIYFGQDAGTDKSTKYVIEYTTDGQTWKVLKEYNGDASVELDVSSQNIKAKAVRIRNLELNLKVIQQDIGGKSIHLKWLIQDK
ncbi:MAG: discoidin domain-containing protein [Faecalibacillus faecis]